MKRILVINAGSSSLKYQLLDMSREIVLAGGVCERIGLSGSSVTHTLSGTRTHLDLELATHAEALEQIVQFLTTGAHPILEDPSQLLAIGHRLAAALHESARITPDILREIEDSLPIAPLHVPAMLACIDACGQVFPHAVQVAVYDNAFHLTMPPKAYLYAIPYELYARHGMRRFGYHGTSIRYVMQRLTELTKIPAAKLKTVVCHLGNGVSVSAVDGGQSVDTTMGYASVAGMPMGTRCGDIDPAMVLQIMARERLTLAQTDDLLCKQAGLLGVSGLSSDLRDLEAAAAQGHQRARLALELQRYQIKKQIGAYAAAMGGLDAVIFTGGIGEHSASTRAEVCERMELFGIRLDAERNQTLSGQEARISAQEGRVQIWIIPTNEELIIARDAYAVYQHTLPTPPS